MHVIQTTRPILCMPKPTVESFYENLSVIQAYEKDIRSDHYGCREYVPWDSRGNGMGMGINVLGIGVVFSQWHLSSAR